MKPIKLVPGVSTLFWLAFAVHSFFFVFFLMTDASLQSQQLHNATIPIESAEAGLYVRCPYCWKWHTYSNIYTYDIVATRSLGDSCAIGTTYLFVFPRVNQSTPGPKRQIYLPLLFVLLKWSPSYMAVVLWREKGPNCCCAWLMLLANIFWVRPNQHKPSTLDLIYPGISFCED